MKNLYRLVYTSYRKTSCTDEEVEAILDSCKRNNPNRDITGVLMHSEKRFLQYLEGDKDELQELYDIIKADPRHGGANQRDFSPIESRIFPSWHMGYKDLSANNLAFDTDISNEDKGIFESLIQGEDYPKDQGVRVLKTFFELA